MFMWPPKCGCIYFPKRFDHYLQILMNVPNLVYASMDPASTQRVASSVLVMRDTELMPLNKVVKVVSVLLMLKSSLK